MLSALISFLGGSAFRMIWGEVSSYVNKRQEHAQEQERLKLQSELESRRHDRDMERLKLQADLDVREVQVMGDLAIQKTEAEAFVEAMKSAMKPIGIGWVDAWNGCVRPAAASIVLILWCVKLWSQGGVMQPWDMEISGAVLGFFFADRSLGKRGR